MKIHSQLVLRDALVCQKANIRENKRYIQILKNKVFNFFSKCRQIY